MMEENSTSVLHVLLPFPATPHELYWLFWLFHSLPMLGFFSKNSQLHPVSWNRGRSMVRGFFSLGRKYVLLTAKIRANLANNIPKPFIHTTEYSSNNLTQVQELWDAINFDEGQISIPHDVAAEMQLPPAQPFPWDPTRGIYLVNAYHNLHCLVHLFYIIPYKVSANTRI